MKVQTYPQAILPAKCFQTIFAGIVLLTAHVASADTILVNDNFTLSSGTNVSTVNNTQSSGTGTWASIQGGTSTVMSVVATGTTYGNFGNGNILQNTNASANTLFRAFTSGSFTLNSLATGEVLRMSFDFRIGGGTMTSGDNFSFGYLFRNGSAGDSVVYTNVDLFTATGTSALNSEFRYRPGSFNMVSGGTQIGAGWNETSVFTPGGIYSFKMDITKQSDGGVLLEYYRDNSLTGSVLATGTSAFMTAVGGIGINGIALRHGESGSGVSYYYDNITALIVPEPAASVLLLGCGATLLLVRRRRAMRF